MQAMKCRRKNLFVCPDWRDDSFSLDGAMNQQMKLTIRPKIESYVKRAEEIKDILKNGGPKKKAVADSANGRGNGKDKSGDDDDGDPDKKRMMQKFEGSSESTPVDRVELFFVASF